jgi:hypothetical protein
MRFEWGGRTGRWTAAWATLSRTGPRPFRNCRPSASRLRSCGAPGELPYSALLSVLRATLVSRTTLALENAALRQQLAVYQRNQKRTRLRTEDRLFWVVLHRFWLGWDRAPVVVKSETVIARHRQGFKVLWRRRSRSRRIGRPCIPQRHISVIPRASGDHPRVG